MTPSGKQVVAALLLAASIVLLGCVSQGDQTGSGVQSAYQSPPATGSVSTVPVTQPTLPPDCPRGYYECNGGCLSDANDCSTVSGQTPFALNCPTGYTQCGIGCIANTAVCCGDSGGFGGSGSSACMQTKGGYCGPDTQNNCQFINSTITAEMGDCFETTTTPEDYGGYPPVGIGGGAQRVLCSSINASLENPAPSNYCCITPSSQSQGSLDCPEGYGICDEQCVAVGSPCCIGGVCFPMGATHIGPFTDITTSSPSGSSGGNQGSSTGGAASSPSLDPQTGCPPAGDSNLQCSGWAQLPSCSIQTCACYYTNGCHSYFETSDGEYFLCNDCTSGCVSTAEAAAAHCGGSSDPWYPS